MSDLSKYVRDGINRCMRARDRLEMEIAQMREQIKQKEIRLHEVAAELRVLKQTRDMLPKELIAEEAIKSIKPGSAADDAVRALRKANKPLNVNEMLRLIGKEATVNMKRNMRSALVHYIKQGKVFKRVDAGLYGLLEWDDTEEKTEEQVYDLGDLGPPLIADNNPLNPGE